MNTVESPIFSGSITLTSVQAAIIKSLLYYDIFEHPLRKEELYSMLSIPGIEKSEFEVELQTLISDGIVTDFNGFFTVFSCAKSVKRRIEGEAKAAKMLDKVKKYSRLIASFPYVRTVCLSGSFSKHVMNDDSDVDYFIITAPNRLWIARTFLILFKKIFLLNSKKYFCVNYFIAEDNSEISEKNIFTATEIATLIPVYNYEGYQNFLNTNSWYKQFYPDFPARAGDLLVESSNGLKRAGEVLLNSGLGNKLDNLFFRITLRHWEKKFSNINRESFQLRLRSKKSESKHHPQGFQERVLEHFGKMISRFEQEFKMKVQS